MTDISRAFHEVVYERDFLLKRGDSFQDFFSTIMEKRHPGDFVRVKPWGKIGDEKNDGYLKSAATVYQCYGPNEMSANDAVTKIETDFAGAKDHWPDMKGWTFVHNAWDGLSAPVLKKLNDLQVQNPGIDIGHMGKEELRIKVFELSPTDRDSLLGPAPTMTAFIGLGFEDLRPVLDQLEGMPPVPLDEIRPVPPDKVAYNKLSDDAEALIRIGMGRSDLVNRFLSSQPDPNRGDRIATTLTNRYKLLRGRGLPPDVILAELQGFAVGENRATAQREAAALAVLAYFFEQCDIFERPPESA